MSVSHGHLPTIQPCLLCDEATSALDPTTTRSILNLLKKINKELNITIVLITHEMNVVKEICNRMAIMQKGKVIEEGSVYDIFANPQTELAKEFINSVVSFDIPAAILEKCKGTIVKVTFKGNVAGEGVISDTLQQFNVKGNFLHGSIDYIGEAPLRNLYHGIETDKRKKLKRPFSLLKIGLHKWR